MKKYNRVAVFAIAVMLALVLGSTAQAGNRSGSVSLQFLKIPTSSRAIGMGGSSVAMAEGANSLAFNPAGMLSIENTGVGLTHTSWLADIQHSFVGAVHQLPGFGTVGVGLTVLTTDDMKETTPQFPDGTGRYFRSSEFAFSVGFARQVTDQFRFGLSGKIIRSYLFNTEFGASTFAFDIGTLYDIPALHSRLGVSVTNIGKDIEYIEEIYSLPTSLKFGVAVDVVKEENSSLVTTMMITRYNDADEQYNLGAEYEFNHTFALRGGYKFFYDQEDVTAGFGLKTTVLGLRGTLDYGYNNFKYLPGTHSFTVEVQF